MFLALAGGAEPLDLPGAPVDDEIVLDVVEDELEIIARMANAAFDGLLPGMTLPVETSIGRDWGHMELYM